MDYAYRYSKLMIDPKKIMRWINAVRLYKKLVLPFEIVNINGKQLTNTYQNNEEVSVVKWLLINEEIPQTKPTSAEVREQNKLKQ